ncbi:hypothetical protein [Actibacterium lipolyticum]|uniref:Uncharacterized protein n=1 Tax=Actibacterium lipolyticum TaxID=1524263 RepID=A0A238JN09_9RHOB|nr:hypothetical protein [Actibacterium lipolyticum]SMX32031.1 hypothetical protein COL8621_00688 [Actibacterium lipolyticum]
MRIHICLFLWAFGASSAQAESHVDFGFPQNIDMVTQRALFGEAFPEIDVSFKKLDSLLKYRRDLEIYRATHLEAFNERILAICEELERVERRVAASFAKGDLSRNEKASLDQRIADERANCRAQNKGTSKYYKLYDTFLEIYRTQSSSSKDELDRCYASDPCRLRNF